LDDQSYVFMNPYGAQATQPTVAAMVYHVETQKVYTWGPTAYNNSSLTAPDFSGLYMLQTFQTDAMNSSSLSLGFVPARTWIDPDTATRPPWAFFDSTLHSDIFQKQGTTTVYQPLWVVLLQRHYLSGGLTYPSTVRRCSADMVPLLDSEMAATAAETKVYLNVSQPATASSYLGTFSMYDTGAAQYFNPTYWNLGRYHDMFTKVYWTVGGIPATGSTFDAGVNVRMAMRSLVLDFMILGQSARAGSAT
jgi:hypothetical protein